MSKVDMSRYIECPKCHTFQISISPCQKCMARRLAAEGKLPASGIVPYDPFKTLCSLRYDPEKVVTEGKKSKPKRTPEEKMQITENRKKRMLAVQQIGFDRKRQQVMTKRVPVLVSALSDGESHYMADLTRNHIIPFGVSVTTWVVTRTMLQMGLLEWSKDGPNHNSPIRIWIPALKMAEALEYAKVIENGKD